MAVAALTTQAHAARLTDAEREFSGVLSWLPRARRSTGLRLAVDVAQVVFDRLRAAKQCTTLVQGLHGTAGLTPWLGACR